MDNTCKFSANTQMYLDTFYAILDEMIEGMTTAKLTDSISHNFIAQMIPHHRAAIEMSRNLLKYTTNIPLQDIAGQIITEQTKSIHDMRQIERRCGQYQNSRRDLHSYQCRMEQILQTMFHEMGTACAANPIDADFMREMIPHHEGAIHMSETTLCYPICPELVPILRAIITSQKRGVRQMRRLLCTGCR